MSKILILGSGISGCTAALEFAKQGHAVTIVEKGSQIGGKVISYCCKATDECSRCGVCVAHTTISEAIQHQRINIMTASSVQDVRNSAKKIHVGINIKQSYPVVSYNKCNGCDACIEKCPVNCITKYDRGGLVFYSIDYSKCLRHNGKECNKCVEACPTSAISGVRKTNNASFDAVLIATGHQTYDVSQHPALGYGRLDGVITGEDAERILSTQNYLRSPSEDVAFMQCVGSRDPQIGRNYCSSVCCPYAVRMARILKYRNPEGKVTIYYIDLQNFDKTFSSLRTSLIKEGINFVRAIPFSIERNNNGKLKLRVESSKGTKSIEEHDTVVLSVGIGPTHDALNLVEMFDLKRDKFGFIYSNVPNIFVTGTCMRPQSIVESMSSAKSVAAEIMKSLPRISKIERAVSSTDMEIKKVKLSQHVLVIGAGIAGCQTASELKNYGYNVTMVERSDRIGGKVASWDSDTFNFAGLVSGVDVLTEAYITKFSGSIGSFKACLDTVSGIKEVECGAVVVSPGIRLPVNVEQKINSGDLMTIADLNTAMSRFSRKDRPCSVGLVLDMDIEETKASTEMALKCALNFRKNYHCEVYMFYREMRVDAKELESLYDEARDAAVNMVKYEGAIELKSSEHEMLISTRDSILDEDIMITCHIIGISPYGLKSTADTNLASILGIGLDSFGQMQENNIHLFPELTNKPGVFVVGACRGQYYVPEILNDARTTAFRVHSLLSQKYLAVELSNAVVDEDKCALCLTCVRSCPHGAMVIDTKKGVAVSIPEVCQKCGVCVAECPAGAIELPEKNEIKELASEKR